MIRFCLVMLLLCDCGSALGQKKPDPIWQDQARKKYEQALVERAQGDRDKAIDLLRQALQDDHTQEPLYLELASLHQEEQAHDQAIEILERADRLFPNKPAIVLPLVEEHLIQNNHDRNLLKQLALRLVRLRGIQSLESRVEVRKDVLLRQARVATALRHDDQTLNFLEEWQALSPGRDLIHLQMGIYHNAFGRTEAAIRSLNAVQNPPERDVAKEILDDMRRQRYQRYHPFLPPSAPLPERVSADLLAVEELISNGNYAQCMSLLEGILANHPTSIRILQLKGDCLLIGDEMDRAELYYLRALSMNPSEHDILVSLAALHERRGKWAFVIEYADRALELPVEDLKQLHLQRINAYQALHRPNDALRMVKIAISALKSQEDIPTDDLRNLAVELQSTTTLDDRNQIRRSLRDPIVADVRRLMSTDAFEEALNTIERIRPSKRTAELHGLHGQILFVLERNSEAIAPLKRALDSRPNMIQANLTLAKILLLNPATVAQAEPYLHIASRAGSVPARFELIRLHAQPAPEVPFLHDLVNVSDLIQWTEDLDMLKKSAAAPKAEIEALRMNLSARIETVYSIYGTVLIVLALLFLFILKRRFGGTTLNDLMDRYPTTNPETHRVISAIRHEVLKHNSTALQGLLQGIENGDDVHEQADWCYQALIGHDVEDDGSAYVRLKAYIEQLNQLGKAHGLRLNLKYKDPAIAPILRGFALLSSMEKQFIRVATGQRVRGAMLRRIRKATRLINGVGFRQIIQLLKALRNLSIDETICADIFQTVRQEPAFSGREVRFHFDSDPGLLPLELPVAKEDFEDILRNPFRNAIQASAAEMDAGVIHVGLDIRRDIEMITGEVSTIFVVKDRSSKTLPPSALSDSHRERGLGIMRTLVTKYDGTLEVTPLDSPWSKGLVISLPWDEAPAEQWEL